MTAAPAYNGRVRALFAAPAHAGEAAGPAASVERGGQAVTLSAELAGSRLSRLRFRALGCPHVIAACEAVCAVLEGRDAAELGRFGVRSAVADLEVPVEKTGRMLLVEDALRALSARIAASGHEKS